MDLRQRKRNKQLAQQVNSPFAAKKGKDWKLALLVTAGILLVAGGVVGAALLGWLNIPGLTPHNSGNVTPGEAMPDTKIHIIAGGDLNVTDKSVAAGERENGYEYSGVFLDVMPVLSGGDMTLLNFEGNLCGQPYGSTYSSAPQQMVEALRNAGVDILQTANSKTITGGLLGMSATISGIRSAGMEALGSYANSAEFDRYGGYLIREIQGIKVAFVAFTKGMDGRGLPEGNENCVNLLYTDYASTYQKVDESRITRILRAAKAQKPDIIIAMLHWGSEFNDQISSTQKKITTILQNEGVDAIIGTHPHYVQKMSLDASSGQFIAYSLGDFFGDAEKAGTNYSVLLDLEITKNGRTGEVKITNYSYTPIFTAYEENGARILRIREAMTAYEKGSLGRVSQETYEAMKNALERIESRVKG